MFFPWIRKPFIYLFLVFYRYSLSPWEWADVDYDSRIVGIRAG